MSVDADTFRGALGRFLSGVTVLTTVDREGRDRGMTVSSFCSASLHPPLVLACIEHTSDTYSALRDGATHFGVSILSSDQEPLSRRFAEGNDNRFQGVGFTRAPSGVALLDGALAHLECRLVDSHSAGDHDIFLGEVLHAEVFPGSPLVYYRGGYGAMDGR